MSLLSKKEYLITSTVAKSARRSILAMTTNAGSGHPGGSLSCVDYLALLYTQIISKTGEPVIVSNGHISPAVYAILAEMGYINKQDVIDTFRKNKSIFEGHVARQVPGVWYGTGPLGTGAGAASGFALAQKIKKQDGHVYCLIGDGESQEGQVYEMMNMAKKYKLNNLILFMDYNQVQLSDSLRKIMPINPAALFKAAGWNVVPVDGHSFPQMWRAMCRARKEKNKPTILIGHTVMGKGVDFMEKEGQKRRSTWHGKAATADEIVRAMHELNISADEKKVLHSFVKQIDWKPKNVEFAKTLSSVSIKIGRPKVYSPDEQTDCRTAYGKALLDLAKSNKNIVALTADLSGSVRTQYVQDEIPERHIDVGVAEQEMVSCAGGMSLYGIVPFASTFGAFMSSRAKDQARVNDLNHCNVKMVATHCGLSVGEDGPTHQAIDDSGSFLGMFHTMQIEPADPNQCDRMTRYIASVYGNVYMRMGRHKVPVLTKESGKPFFDASYKYAYGKCDVLRKGKDVTIAAMGSTVSEAYAAWKLLKEKGISAEVVIVSSIKKFDKTLFASIKKTKNLITVEDHCVLSGLASQLSAVLLEKRISVKKMQHLGVKKYQMSGSANELYRAAGIDSSAIARAAYTMVG